jgi:hypothetical protein
MSQRSYEAYQVIAPFQGSTGLANQASFAVSQTARFIDLTTVFGQLGSGHFFTLQADGAKVYVAVAPHDKQTIADNATGAGPSVCYPIPDGQSIPFIVPGGRTRGSGAPTGPGYVTMVSYLSMIGFWAKVASAIGSGSATGYIRVWRSSAGPGQGLEQFPPTGF